MKPISTFLSVPSLPPELEPLRELAYNTRWAWNHAAISLFRRLDSDLWETTGHNPVLMLGMIDQAALEAAANDAGFLSHMRGVYEHLQGYLTSVSTWFSKFKNFPPDTVIAYFSAEFGVTECLSVFAGGLGMLAGDHLKSASDLGVPLVGVGLLYQQGYFSQYLNEAGWQQEYYADNDFQNLPISLEKREDGNPQTIEMAFPGRTVVAQIWKAQVGRVALYLLDTNIPVNQPDDRNITDQLYGGDLEMRIKQEIVLGIGGYRTLKVLGITPSIYHMNEGHSAFLSLERTRNLMRDHNLSFSEAREAATAGLVFTTHTPVTAGQDYFSPELMDRYFSNFIHDLGISRYDFFALGRQNPNDDHEAFCMTILAIHMAAYSNGVSRLHGEVSRKMWQGLFPGVPVEEIPISHVTNGVHFRSWISREMDQLYERYLGMRWLEEPSSKSGWARVAQIPAEELWRTHEIRRERLVNFTRRRLHGQLERRGASYLELEIADEVLQPGTLTIGFARRFATYKRASLILSDPERLARILNNPTKPVQIIFAGKAHPKDDPGKELIRQVVNMANQERFRRRIVFIEDYDMAVARYLVQGSDVWLNNPMRPLEASGTSGIKAAANGVINVSTLDGWWDEAYRPNVGWAIGRGEQYSDIELQSQVEAQALYDLLEREIVPAFYDRGNDGLPRRWIELMKTSIQELSPFFNTHRMVGEYTERFYVPSALTLQSMMADGTNRVKALANWKAKIRGNWSQIKVLEVNNERLKEVKVRSTFPVTAKVYLGALTPEDVSVELYLGPVNSKGEIFNANAIAMKAVETYPNGVYMFQAEAVMCCRSGMHGFTVRILPQHPDLVTPFLPGLITWA